MTVCFLGAIDTREEAFCVMPVIFHQWVVKRGKHKMYSFWRNLGMNISNIIDERFEWNIK